MSRDDIIKMAREVGFVAYGEDAGEYRIPTPAFHCRLERFAAFVAAHTLSNIDPSKFMSYQEAYEAGQFAEREACAQICDAKVDAEYATGKVDHNEMGWTQACALSIRARGET